MLICQRLNLLIITTRYKDYCKDVSGGDSSGCDQNEAVLSVGYTSDKRDSAHISNIGLQV